MLEIAPRLEWEPVGSYPAKIEMVKRGPAVYRWVRHREGDRDRVLVGETADLHRRIVEYCGHGSTHHVKIRIAFDEHCAGEGEIKLEVLRLEAFAICGVVLAQDKLKDPLVRRVLENLCCAILERNGFELLNDTLVKRQAKELNRLPPEVLIDVLKKAGVTKDKIKSVIKPSDLDLP